MKIVTVYTVTHGNGFSLNVPAASPLLWVEAGTCSAHPAEQQNQAIAPLPLLGLPFKHSVPRTPTGHSALSRAPAGLFSLQLSERLPVPLTPSLLLGFLAAAAGIAAFPDLVTEQWKVTAAAAVELVIRRASEPYRWT